MREIVREREERNQEREGGKTREWEREGVVPPVAHGQALWQRQLCQSPGGRWPILAGPGPKRRGRREVEVVWER